MPLISCYLRLDNIISNIYNLYLGYCTPIINLQLKKGSAPAMQMRYPETQRLNINPEVP